MSPAPPGVRRPLGVGGRDPEPGVGGSGVVGMCVGGGGNADSMAEAISTSYLSSDWPLLFFGIVRCVEDLGKRK